MPDEPTQQGKQEEFKNMPKMPKLTQVGREYLTARAAVCNAQKEVSKMADKMLAELEKHQVASTRIMDVDGKEYPFERRETGRRLWVGKPSKPGGGRPRRRKP